MGANLLPLLGNILLRWRRHRYVIATDIEKMYRQILIHEDDRDLQRILWKYGPSEEIREYTLNTVTYGLACAPFLALRTLKQLTDDDSECFPGGAEVLRRDVYMDDILTEASTIEDLVDFQRQLRSLCAAGGFPLRKWSANREYLLSGIPPDHRLQRDRGLHSGEPQSILGLLWDPATDCFSVAVGEPQLRMITKRSVLAFTAKLFDPLG